MKALLKTRRANWTRQRQNRCEDWNGLATFLRLLCFAHPPSYTIFSCILKVTLKATVQATQGQTIDSDSLSRVFVCVCVCVHQVHERENLNIFLSKAQEQSPFLWGWLVGTEGRHAIDTSSVILLLSRRDTQRGVTPRLLRYGMLCSSRTGAVSTLNGGLDLAACSSCVVCLEGPLKGGWVCTQNHAHARAPVSMLQRTITVGCCCCVKSSAKIPANLEKNEGPWEEKAKVWTVLWNVKPAQRSNSSPRDVNIPFQPFAAPSRDSPV